jgi:hypothetical protein
MGNGPAVTAHTAAELSILRYARSVESTALLKQNVERRQTVNLPRHHSFALLIVQQARIALHWLAPRPPSVRAAQGPAAHASLRSGDEP